MSNPAGLILIAVAIVLVIVALKGTQKAVFPQLFGSDFGGSSSGNFAMTTGNSTGVVLT